MTTLLEDLRGRVGEQLFQRVAGPEGPRRRARIHGTPGPRWFGPDRPIRQVHGDAAMFVGGLRALLLQSLHPLAMAAVDAHSGFRGDPWGRLHRTSHFLAVTTFGTVDDAEAMVARVRAIHRRVGGTAPDGRPYRASDPHLLKWVHIAEVDSFLAAHDAYGAPRLESEGRDGYVADMAMVARKLGVKDPPGTAAELRRELARYRPELAGTDAARAAARFVLLTPPVPLVARPAYEGLAAAAVALLPSYARSMLGLPRLPLVDTVIARPAGMLATRAIRWVLFS